MNYQELIDDKVTMVDDPRFRMMLKIVDDVKQLKGDIVECGVWRGGCSIFLSKIFEEKNIWVCDSFSGFQDPTNGKYFYEQERHLKGELSVSLEEVKLNFNKYNALRDGVFFLEGYVKDTLTPKTCPIKTISLLRIDVDAYSATLEVLDSLYDKVVDGGYVIFDDSCLVEAHEAIKTFFTNKKMSYVVDPVTHGNINIFESSSLPCGCYFRK